MCPLRIGCEHALMAYEKLADKDKALALLDRMWEYGITPDEMSYMPAIRACENAGDFERGNKLFKQMRHHTKLMAVDEEVGLDPNKVQNKPPPAEDAPWRIPGQPHVRWKNWEEKDSRLNRLLASGLDDVGKYLEPPDWEPTR